MRIRLRSALMGLVLLAPVIGIAEEKAEPGFVSLFDGHSLKNWVMTMQAGTPYTVKDSKIICPACPADCTLFTMKEYSNFVLRFEFMMEPRGDNGIAIRSPIEGDPAYQAMEIQILDDAHPTYADVPANWRHGSIWDVVPAKTGFMKKIGDWNEEEITANGRQITVRLNGTTILDTNLDSIKDPAVLKKHPGLQRTKGRIGLMGHRKWVEFRNLRIQELP
jgi:3-keto-disaccharide hydrolase